MSVLTQSLGDGVVVAKRNLIKVKRVPDLLVFSTLSPIMFVLLFAYVFGSAIPVPGLNYREILMAGSRKSEDRSGWAFHVHDDRARRLFTLRFSVAAVDPHDGHVCVRRRRTT